MKANILQHDFNSVDIEVNLGITTTLNLYTKNVCEYHTCNNKHAVYIIDFGVDNEIEFLNPQPNIGIKNEGAYYEIENGN